MPWFIGLINGVVVCVPYNFEDDFERAGPALGADWMQASVLNSIGETSIPFTIDSGAAIGDCETSIFPDFGIATALRTTETGGTSQFIELDLANLWQLTSDPLFFRAYIEVSNFVNPSTGARRVASMRVEGGDGLFTSPSITLRTYSLAVTSGALLDQIIDTSATYPDTDPTTLRFESHEDGSQVLILGGTTYIDTVPASTIVQGTFQGFRMWWDTQFGTCADATSPRVNAVRLGSLCHDPVTVEYFGYNTNSNTNNDFDQTFLVPAGVTSLDVLLNGSASWSATSSAGAAKRFGVTVAVTPGETLTLKVGNIPASSNSAGTAGGWPDGGNGGTNTFVTPDGLGGGGSTSIWRGATLIAIAGGGGGLPNNLTVPLNAYGGGIGGNTFATGAGSDGVSPGVTVADRQGGLGGTQLAGGAGGPRLSRTPTSLPNPATDTVAGGAGSSLQGGDGASDLTDSTFLAGSGGGGGYFGGGGGSKRKQPVDGSGNSAGSGGGGGSSWYDTGLASGAVDDGTLSTTYGYVSITYTPA